MDTQTPADPFAVTTEARLRELYDQPLEGPIKKVTHRIEAAARAWIAASPFCIISTVGSRGVHATPRGDAPGSGTSCPSTQPRARTKDNHVLTSRMSRRPSVL